MNRKKIIIVVIAITIVIVALYFILRKPKPAMGVPLESATPPSINFPLKLGSKGVAVTQVQKYLNQKYNAGLTTDGIWGAKTDAAVQSNLMRDNISEDVYYKWSLDKL